jgi:hypothetical protein
MFSFDRFRSRFPDRPFLPAIVLAAVFALPAAAQVDFSGEWAPLYHEDNPERIPGPELGDYMGIPINNAARLRGDAYDADRIAVVTEYQCRPHGSDYSMRGAANMRIDQEYDSAENLLAIHTRMSFQEQARTIWMDSRAHPGDMVAHTFQGFSTGTFDNNMLNIYTTHLKTSYLRRNGLPRSDKATFTEHWTRHGNYLTVTTVITDPVFLEEPLVRSESWILDPGQWMGRYFCEAAPEIVRPGVVPNHLPGTNPYLHEVANWYGLPYEATRGGAATLYPEYRKKAGKPDVTPEKCVRFCKCGQNGGGCAAR